MSLVSEAQTAQNLPPRRGATLALTVDSTARAYDITGLTLGGKTPEAAASLPSEVALFLQADTNDVFFVFSSVTASDLSDTAAIAAGGTLAFANTHGAVLKAGNPPLKVRLNRAQDKFLVVKAASTSGTLRIWSASEAS